MSGKGTRWEVRSHGGVFLAGLVLLVQTVGGPVEAAPAHSARLAASDAWIGGGSGRGTAPVGLLPPSGRVAQ